MKKLLSLVLSLFIIAGATMPAIFNSAYAAEPESIENYGVINFDPSFTSYSELGVQSRFSKQVGKTVSLPESYSSLDLGYITPVKFQGDYGTCWAISTMTASEASMIKNLGYENTSSNRLNLSELQFAYFLYNNAYDSMNMLKGDANIPNGKFLGVGCIPEMIPFALSSWIGVADTSASKNYSYSKIKANYKINDKTEAYKNDIAHLENMAWVCAADINDMKNMIIKYGAGTLSYTHSDIYMNTTNHCYYMPQKLASNHMVTVVGWDDNFSKDNFNKKYQPSENGAWLCQNSWDSDWGDKGYFWISYENATSLSKWCQFFEYGKADNYNKNYQYDGTANPYTEDIALGGTMANVFMCESGEELKAVSFWTAQNDVEYTINIYKNLTDLKDPSSGTSVLKSAITGTQDYCGYHTVKLDEAVRLNAGEMFSVTVTLSSNAEDTTKLFVDCSTDDDTVQFISTAKEGQSFFQSANSLEWTDISADGKNYRIKAFTDIVDDSVIIKYDDSPDEIESDTDEQGFFSSLFDRIYNWFTGGDKGEVSQLGYMLGDVNSDEATDMLDVVTMQKNIAKLTELNETQQKAADIDEDGEITMTDVVILQLHLAKLL